MMIKESMLPMKQRIWELDALRGIGILVMTAVHLCYDLAEFWRFPTLTELPLFSLMLEYGGILFVLLSGLCATLGQIGRAHRLNSSHANISYAVFCLKKKKESP